MDVDRDLDLHQLRTLVAVADEGHFGRAAALVHVAPSAVTRQVHAVESAIGAPLLIRDRRGATTTAAGDLLLPRVRRALRTLARADAALGGLSGRPPTMATGKLELQQLQAFVTVCEERGITAASERLDMTRARVLRLLAGLESRVGLPLVAHGRGVSPTLAGLELLTAAESALRDLTAGVRAARMATAPASPRLSVGHPAGDCVPLLATVLRAMLVEHPEVEVSLCSSPWSDPSCGLREGAVDVALVRAPLDVAGLEVRTLLTESRVAIVPAGHRLAGAGTAPLRALLDEPVVAPRTADATWRSFSTCDGRRPARPPTIAWEAHDIDDAVAASARHGAVAFLPASARLHAIHPRAVYLTVPDLPPARIGLAHRAGPSAQVRAFARLATALAAA